MSWDLADVIVKIIKAVFWLFLLWRLVTKGFVYCIILAVITRPLLEIAIMLFLSWESVYDRKKHPEKYKNEKPDNFVYME